MVYIQSYDIIQESFGKERYSKIRVEWEFGDQLPDFVEIYIGATISQVRVVGCQRSVILLAPRREIVNVRVCPRLIASQSGERHIFKNDMPNDQMQELHWEAFCWIGSLYLC